MLLTFLVLSIATATSRGTAWIGDKEKVYDGWTTISYSLAEDSTTVLIDNSGKVLHTWNLSDCGEATSFAYLQPNGDLVYPCDKSGEGGPNGGGTLHRYDWDGNRLWQYTIRSENITQHHDIQPISNGNVLLIAHEKKTRD